MVFFPHSYAKLDYDPFKDYVPVAHLASFPLAFGVGPACRPRRWPSTSRCAKKGGAYANFAAAGAGSLPHFFGLMFARTAGSELTHIPYKGTAGVPALMSGEIPAAVLSSTTSAAVQSGKAASLRRQAQSARRIPSSYVRGIRPTVADWHAAAIGQGPHPRGPAPADRANIPTCRPSRRAATTSRARPGTACSRQPARPRRSSTRLHGRRRGHPPADVKQRSNRSAST